MIRRSEALRIKTNERRIDLQGAFDDAARGVPHQHVGRSWTCRTEEALVDETPERRYSLRFLAKEDTSVRRRVQALKDIRVVYGLEQGQQVAHEFEAPAHESH